MTYLQTYLKVLDFLTNCRVDSNEFVSKIISILLIIFHVIYGAVCIRFTYFSYDECEFTLS